MIATEDRIGTGTIVVDGIPTFYRQLPGEGPPAVFVHGNPTDSGDWVPFLVHMQGPAIALDLPGFGRSANPTGFDYSMHGYARFVERFLEAMEVDRYSLVLHDWGAVALIAAQRAPDRLLRLVVINAVPLLPGYRWHRVARVWRTRGLGEAANRLWARRIVALGLRESRGDRGRQPDELVDMVWRGDDAGRRRAILDLYRSADERELADAGARLDSIKAPALVIWGLRDRYLSGRFARAYADRLPNAELWELPKAGHWPWWEQPEVVDRVNSFLEAS